MNNNWLAFGFVTAVLTALSATADADTIAGTCVAPESVANFECDYAADEPEQATSGVLTIDAHRGSTFQAVPSFLDFGPAAAPAELTVEILNTGADAVTIGTIAKTDALAAPFSIVSDECSLSVVEPLAQCSVVVRFAPEGLGQFGDSFDVPSDDVNTPNLTVQMAGFGLQTVAVDLLPGECPNEVDLDARATVPVAILGSATFDVSLIDPASVRFAATPARRSYVADVATPYLPVVGKQDADDCNALAGDGFPDLVLAFESARLRDVLGDAAPGEVIVLPLKADQLVPAQLGVVVGEDVLVVTGDPAARAAQLDNVLQNMKADMFSRNRRSDLNGDGRVDYADLWQLRQSFPGASRSSRGGGPLPTVSLIPSNYSGNFSEQVELEVWIDFSSHPILGGGWDIQYDESLLDYESFTFDSDYSGDPLFSRAPDELPGGVLSALAIGNFETGMLGPERIGVLTFSPVLPGLSNLTMETNFDIAGGIISFATGEQVEVNYLGASVTVIPSLAVTPAAIDFGLVVFSAEQVVTVTNGESGTVAIGEPALADALLAPFSIINDGCSGVLLGSLETCELTVVFAPTEVGIFSDSFDIPSDSAVTPSLTVTVTGEGDPQVFAGLVVTPDAVNFGIMAGTGTQTVQIFNPDPIAISVGSIATVDSLAAPFEIIDDACTDTVLESQTSCEFTVSFAPGETDNYADTFDIPSDSLLTPGVTVPVDGIGVRTVAVDVLPGVCPNIFHLDADTSVSLAVLGSAEFDVNRIDRASVRFGTTPPRRSYVADVATPFEPFVGKDDPFDCNNLNGDGFSDLVLIFESWRLQQSVGAAQDGTFLVLPLRADRRLSSGQGPVIGQDVIIIQ